MAENEGLNETGKQYIIDREPFQVHTLNELFKMRDAFGVLTKVQAPIMRDIAFKKFYQDLETEITLRCTEAK